MQIKTVLGILIAQNVDEHKYCVSIGYGFRLQTDSHQVHHRKKGTILMFFHIKCTKPSTNSVEGFAEELLLGISLRSEQTIHL
jgi:hypothetical protein